MKEFIQEFRRAEKGSGYEERSLIEELKRSMNEMIQQKLMKSECSPEVLSNSISKQQTWIDIGGRVDRKKDWEVGEKQNLWHQGQIY